MVFHGGLYPCVLITALPSARRNIWRALAEEQWRTKTCSLLDTTWLQTNWSRVIKYLVLLTNCSYLKQLLASNACHQQPFTHKQNVEMQQFTCTARENHSSALTGGAVTAHGVLNPSSFIVSGPERLNEHVKEIYLKFEDVTDVHFHWCLINHNYIFHIYITCDV